MEDSAFGVTSAGQGTDRPAPFPLAHTPSLKLFRKKKKGYGALGFVLLCLWLSLVLYCKRN